MTLDATIAVAVITGLFSSGFMGMIQFLITRHDQKETQDNEALKNIADAVRGLDHDRLYFLATKFIQNGSISREDYENLNEYIYQPYKKLGGNGTGDKLMKEVEKLPIREKEGI